MWLKQFYRKWNFVINISVCLELFWSKKTCSIMMPIPTSNHIFVSVCLYPLKVKTTEPIGQIFLAAPRAPSWTVYYWLIFLFFNFWKSTNLKSEETNKYIFIIKMILPFSILCGVLALTEVISCFHLKYVYVNFSRIITCN